MIAFMAVPALCAHSPQSRWMHGHAFKRHGQMVSLRVANGRPTTLHETGVGGQRCDASTACTRSYCTSERTEPQAHASCNQETATEEYNMVAGNMLGKCGTRERNQTIGGNETITHTQDR